MPRLNLTGLQGRVLDPIQESSMSQRSFDLAPMRGVTHELIEKKSFDEKQADIKSIKHKLESMAIFQADSARNDLTIQLGLDDKRQDAKAATKVEFDPLAYHVAACAKLPEPIREILEAMQELRMN